MEWNPAKKYGGGRGIRTPERLSTLTVFKTAGFNHSPIPPSLILQQVGAGPLSTLLFAVGTFVGTTALFRTPERPLNIESRQPINC